MHKGIIEEFRGGGGGGMRGGGLRGGGGMRDGGFGLRGGGLRGGHRGHGGGFRGYYPYYNYPYYNYPYYNYPYYNYPYYYGYEVPVEMPLVEEPVIMTQPPKNIQQMTQVREKTVEVNQSGSENQGSNNSTTIILIVLGSAIFILACVYFYMSNKDRNRRLGIKSDYLPFTRSNY